jgi:SAM-dependent methyltransferase
MPIEFQELLDERSFVARSRALEELEFVDAALFARLRQEIRSGRLRGAELLGCIDAFVPPASRSGGGYGFLDAFLTQLLLDRPLPTASKTRDVEMIGYQRTPSTIALELIARASLTADDVFYDIGSGLGEVTVLANLLADATAKGVEYEPAYCEYAGEIASDLNLTRIDFLNADARDADFSDGTVFFMYTPFVGGLLRQVLNHLRASVETRRIRVFTYGPCTPEIAAHGWLTNAGPAPPRADQLAEFGTGDVAL